MGTLDISFFFLIFFLNILQNFPNFVTSEELCPIYQWCGKDEPTIRFPFTIKGHKNELCGYPGFNLKCNSLNRTILELPNSGEFLVLNIYSFMQKIEIYDPDNCFPKRLLNLNLSGSPYKLGDSTRNYTFLNCSASINNLIKVSTLLKPINCLSSLTHTIIATNVSTHNISPFNTSCEVIATVLVPLTTDGVPYEFTDKFVLSWTWLPLPPYLSNPQQKGKKFLTYFVVFRLCYIESTKFVIKKLINQYNLGITQLFKNAHIYMCLLL